MGRFMLLCVSLLGAVLLAVAAESSPARVHEQLQQELHQALSQLATLPERVGPAAQEVAAP